MIAPRIRVHFLAVLLITGCALGPPATSVQSARPDARQIEVAFSPEAGAQALVLKTIASATQTLRLAGYSFTSPDVVRSLLDAKKRGVDVQVLIDDNANRGRSSIVAIGLIASAGIPVRTINSYAIHHDKYIVVDGRTTETGSFNYSRAAGLLNSENVIVIWNDPQVAAAYLAHWSSRWALGVPVK